MVRDIHDYDSLRMHCFDICNLPFWLLLWGTYSYITI